MKRSWGRATVLLLLVGFAACSDPVGPDRTEGALLAAGSLALEWSADGSEIFYFDSGYSRRAITPPPDRILAVNVATRATRVVVASGAYGFTSPMGIGAQGIPPRVTIAGLAYLRIAGDTIGLRVVTDSGDIPLVASGAWFTTTPDRRRLLYSPAAWNPFDDSVGVIDLVTGSRSSVPTGPYHPVIGKTISPDGTQLLVARQDAAVGFGILNLSTGAITVLHDSLFPPVTSLSPIALGWNATGVWFVQQGGPPHLIRYNPATSGTEWFPIGDSTSGTRVVTGGAALPQGSSVVWSQNCNSTDPLSGTCTDGAYALWLVNPLARLDEPLVGIDVMPDFEFPRVFFAAPSPDGRTLAYVLGNEVRLLRLP